MDEFHDWGDDFSAYLSQSKVIHNKEYSRLGNCVKSRIKYSEFQVGPNYYPWFYPLSLSIGFLFDKVEIQSLKQISFIYSVIFYFALFFLFQKRLGFVLSLILIILFALHPFFIESNQYILSDVYASGILLISFYVMERAFVERNLRKKSICFVAFIIVSCLAVNIRTSSNIIYLVAILYAILNFFSDQKIQNISLTIVSLILSFWLSKLINAQFPSSDYLENHQIISSDFFSVIDRNSVYYLDLLINFFFPFPLFAKVSFIVFFCLIFYRKKRLIWTNFSYAERIFVPLYFGLFLVYPYQQGLRFIIPVLPFGFFILFLLLKRGKLGFEKIFCYSYLIFFLSFGIASSINKYDQNRNKFNSSFANSIYAEEVYNFIVKNTSKSDSIVFFKPRALTYFTDRCSVWIESPDYLTMRESYFLFFKGKEYMNSMKDFLKVKKQIFKNEFFILYSL